MHGGDSLRHPAPRRVHARRAPAATQPASTENQTKKRLKDTLNLPKTDFAMKANLPTREPERLAAWEDIASTSRFAAPAPAHRTPSSRLPG